MGAPQRLVLVAMVVIAIPAAAQSAPPPGAAACWGCHRLAGQAAGPVPSIAGRPAAEIVAAMQAYRAGQGSPTVMDRIAKGFSDEETRAIAEWFALQR